MNKPLKIRLSMINNIDSGFYSKEIKNQIDAFELPLEVPVIEVDSENEDRFNIISGHDTLKTMKEEGFRDIWCLTIYKRHTKYNEAPKAKPVLPGRIDVQEVIIYKGSKNNGFKTERGAKAAKTRLEKQDKYQGYDLRVTKRDGVYVIRIKEIEEEQEVNKVKK